jgi:CHASE3 domain sensor protein
MDRFGIRLKLALGFGLLLTMLVALGVLSYYAIFRVTSATEEANDDQSKERNCILTEVALREQIQAANQYVFNGDAESLKNYGEAKHEAEDRVAAIKKMLITIKGREVVGRFEVSERRFRSSGPGDCLSAGGPQLRSYGHCIWPQGSSGDTGG